MVTKAGLHILWAGSISLDSTWDILQWKKDGLDLINDHSYELREEFRAYYYISKDVNLSSLLAVARTVEMLRPWRNNYTIPMNSEISG